MKNLFFLIAFLFMIAGPPGFAFEDSDNENIEMSVDNGACVSIITESVDFRQWSLRNENQIVSVINPINSPPVRCAFNNDKEAAKTHVRKNIELHMKHYSGAKLSDNTHLKLAGTARICLLTSYFNSYTKSIVNNSNRIRDHTV